MLGQEYITIVLIAIIWIMYGVFAVAQARQYIKRRQLQLNEKYTNSTPSKHEYMGWTAFLYILGAPIVFICKALFGAFKRYK